MYKSTLYLLFLAFVFCKCSKEATAPTSIYGRWQLTEELADPGDGSGTWQPVSKNTDKYIIFNEDGTIKSNFFGDMVAFSVKGDNYIEITNSTHEETTFWYELVGKTLTLSPPCIEACGMRFKKGGP